MSRTTSFLISLLIFIKYVDSARILAMFPIPSISHQVVFRPITQELAKRGHDVIVITPDPAFQKNQSLPNLTEIDVHDISYSLWTNHWTSKINLGKANGFYGQMEKALEILSIIFEQQILSDEVQEIINNKEKKIDLLMVEAPLTPALGLSYIFKVPVISISSLGAIWDDNYIIGAATHPILFPGMTASLKQNNLSYLDKIQELYIHWRMSKLKGTRELEDDKMMRKIFGSNIPPLSELKNNIDMLFLNVHSIWDTNRPVPPNVIYMGGLHIHRTKDLPKDLETYLNASKHGVIYFSFGTNTIPSRLQGDIIKTFITVFSKLPYDVLWKWDADELPGRTKNIRIFKWLPQSDLLHHPKVKLFITQGGLQSTDEAITAGVPLIGIPMLGDQWFNVEKYVQLKIGIRLDLDQITEDSFKNAIETVIGDNSYRMNIEKLRSIMNDQPLKPLERAVWWTEHLLRHGGTKHLRSPSANMSWTQYYEVDLIIIVLVSLIVSVCSILTVFVFIWKLVSKIFTTPKIKKS